MPLRMFNALLNFFAVFQHTSGIHSVLFYDTLDTISIPIAFDVEFDIDAYIDIIKTRALH